MKSLKLNFFPGENVTYFWATILVDSERIQSAVAFKPEPLGYINHIFEDSSDSRFRIWKIHNYKEVTKFIKKLCVCEMDAIPPDEIITYESLVQEATCEYQKIINSKRWEPDTVKENYQYQYFLPNSYTVAIDHYFNKTLKKVDFKILRSGNCSGSGEGSYTMSNVTCHKCGKKVHTQKDCRSNGTVSSGNTYNKYKNKLPEWVNTKLVVSDTKDMETATMK